MLELKHISKEYNISSSDILTYNNKTDETLKIGEYYETTRLV